MGLECPHYNTPRRLLSSQGAGGEGSETLDLGEGGGANGGGDGVAHPLHEGQEVGGGAAFAGGEDIGVLGRDEGAADEKTEESAKSDGRNFGSLFLCWQVPGFCGSGKIYAEEFKCVWSLKSLHGFRESVPRGIECGSRERIGQPDQSLRSMCLILHRKAPVIRERFYPG